MPSPFLKYSNLRLIVPVYQGSFQRNPETGNLEQGVRYDEYKASVDVGYETDTRQEKVGADTYNIYLSGYFTKPKNIPSSLTAGVRVKAYLLDPSTKQEVEGEFLTDTTLQPRFKQVSKALGSTIKGWFMVVS